MTSGWPFARACRWEELVDQCRLQRRPLSRSAPVSLLITITFEFQKQISSSSLGFHSARFLSLVCSKERRWRGCARARPAAARRLCPWAGLKLIHPNRSCVGSVRPFRVREAVSGRWLCTTLLESSYCIKKRLLIWSVCAARGIWAASLSLLQPVLISLRIFNFFQEIGHYGWLHYLQFFFFCLLWCLCQQCLCKGAWWYWMVRMNKCSGNSIAILLSSTSVLSKSNLTTYYVSQLRCWWDGKTISFPFDLKGTSVCLRCSVLFERNICDLQVLCML